MISFVVGFFCLILYGVYTASPGFKVAEKPTTSTVSNGTSKFAPTTILVSLDGFRADFLERDLTPTLSSFIAEGVSPKYMLPSFPSVTFPNHYTMLTGLYPESHGIVGNTFWDPHLQEEFYYTDPARSMQSKWWSEAEPLWVTAERQDIKTAIHMWPGSEAHIQLEPTFVDKYNGSESLDRKVNRIFQFLDLPSHLDPGYVSASKVRPQFIAFYVPNVDGDGHKYGPNSTEIRKTIKEVDNMLHDLFQGLQERNLSDIVNVVVVSDHGMASTTTDRLIQLEDLIDVNLVEHIDGWPLFGLRPKNPVHLQDLYETLLAQSKTNPNFDIYLRDKNMPERYHFTRSERIAPLWIIPKTGWAIVSRKDFDVKEDKAKTYNPRGLHGYDHENPLMRAIFVARGPAFPHKPNSQLEVFQNTEVYNILCDSLGMEPKPNNGTLRLPLRPIGLHSDTIASEEANAAELPSITRILSTASTLTATSAITSSTSSWIGVNFPEMIPLRPVIKDGKKTAKSPKRPAWLQGLIDKIRGDIKEIKTWLGGFLKGTGGRDT